jgi:nicotinamide phosphoribosyltransferase
MSRVDGVKHVVNYGLQGGLMDITEQFDDGFFSQPIDKIEKEYKETQADIFGKTNPEFAKNADTTHLRQLHKLGHLPLKIKALPEGTFTPVGVPMFTLENTDKDAFWLAGYMESQLSPYIWLPMTAATIADKYKRILTKYAKETGDESKVFTQASDFSMRGMSSPESAMRVSGGHLLSFAGTATVNARNYLMSRYNAKGDVISYLPSTEHSVMCSYGENELDAFRKIITEIYPSGNISIVADTYDFWNVVDNVLPELRDTILARTGKVVIRPDSGDPVKIICGDPQSRDETERKGLIQRLGEIFGGKTNAKGYMELPPQIGAVYGDSITPDRAVEICEGLKSKNIASTNVNLGVGSFTYQYNTRDTFGFALKATAEINNGEFKQIQKRPKTDTGNFKKSQKGMVAVVCEDNDLKMLDGLDPNTESAIKGNMLQEIYKDGKFTRLQSFDEIRERVKAESGRVYGDK